MDSKIALEKMKQLLCDISSKNESLNNENNDLNIKIISLIKLLKSKDNQINILNKKLLKANLKNILYKKFSIQKQKLQNAFDIFKYNLKADTKINNNNNMNFINSKENDLFFNGIKKNNFKDIGIGDFKITQKFFIRKMACLTLFKRRKNNNINDEDDNNKEIKINLKFKNIEQQNEVNNICIKSDRNNNKEKPKYECSIFNIEIKHNNKLKIFDNKFLRSENICKNYSILSDRSYNSLKVKIEQKEKDIKKLENEITNIKKDYTFAKNAMKEYMDKYNFLNNMISKKKKQIIIDTKNKYHLNIKSSNISPNNEIIKINDISIISNNEIKNNKEKIFVLYNNENFDILSQRKKMILKKDSFSLDIFNYKTNNNENLIISKENNINLIQEKKSEKEKIDLQYEILEPLKYAEYKKNQSIIKSFDILEFSNSFSFKYTSPQSERKDVLKISKIFSFDIINDKEEISIDNNKLVNEELEKNNSLLKITILDLKLKIIFYLKPKIIFFIKLIFFYYQKKITESFKMFRNLLINLKLKILIKNKVNGPSRFYFLKYYITKYQLNTLYLSSSDNKKELLKNIETNTKLNSQITLFQETFKKYEESNLKEKKEKDNAIIKQKSIINELNKEISKIKESFEKIKSSAKSNESELISISNESNKMKKTIDKLNKEIKSLQEEKLSYENQIKEQQDLIKNLNEKIKKDQLDYEQNEIDVNDQVEKLKVQFNEYERSIQKLNSQNINLQKENEKLKINNENLNTNKEELLSIIQESKNYEIENESLLSLNKELKNNNDELNSKYQNLKKEFDNLKSMSEESKNELSKALNEMELYSELLQTLEIKVKDAESKKITAENERDKAINDVREIRQRYINIMGEKYA